MWHHCSGVFDGGMLRIVDNVKIFTLIFLSSFQQQKINKKEHVGVVQEVKKYGRKEKNSKNKKINPK